MVSVVVAHKLDVPLLEQVIDVDEIGKELTCNEPPRMFVAPVYVSAPVNNNSPEEIFLKPPVPEISPE